MNSTRKVVIAASAAALLAAFWASTRHGTSELPPVQHIAPSATASAQAETPIARAAKPVSRAVDSNEAIDVCGVGKVRLADARDADEFFKSQTDGAVSALQASSDLRARAAGYVLAGPGSSEILAQLAVQSADPVLYDLALNACAKTEHPAPACSQISPDSWAQLDPDNAAPWLQAAWHARLDGDPAREAAAMRQAAAAQRVEDYHLSLYAYAQAGLPAGLGAVGRYTLSLTAIGVAAAAANANVEASKYCSQAGVGDAAVKDGRVADECRALADLFDLRGRTLMDLISARSIGARVGWSQQRLEAATRYLEALQAVLPNPGPGAEQWSCGALSASNAYVLDMAQTGEISALRGRLEQSGISIAELAQQHRDSVEKWRRAAIDEAVAAENAPAKTGLAQSSDMP